MDEVTICAECGSNIEAKPEGPWTTRTKARGSFELCFPWVGGNVTVKWPATGRQAMLEIAVACLVCVVVVPVSLYIVFVGAVPENISRFSQMVRHEAEKSEESETTFRLPERYPIETDDGIEIIEACPPCPPPPLPPPCPLCPDCECEWVEDQDQDQSR
jgi:hypothetical protein